MRMKLSIFNDCINMPERYKSRDESLIAYFFFLSLSSVLRSTHTYALIARGTISLCVQFCTAFPFFLIPFSSIFLFSITYLVCVNDDANSGVVAISSSSLVVVVVVDIVNRFPLAIKYTRAKRLKSNALLNIPTYTFLLPFFPLSV